MPAEQVEADESGRYLGRDKREGDERIWIPLVVTPEEKEHIKNLDSILDRPVREILKEALIPKLSELMEMTAPSKADKAKAKSNGIGEKRASKSRFKKLEQKRQEESEGESESDAEESSDAVNPAE